MSACMPLDFVQVSSSGTSVNLMICIKGYFKQAQLLLF